VDVGGGIWRPEPEPLRCIRASILERTAAWKRITAAPAIPMPEVTPAMLERQAPRYAELFRTPKRNGERVEAVALWGIDDESPWRKLARPLLFSEYQPKPAFWAVIGEAAR
jgi:GH35 family endo-1,4-beta-xylanase